MRLTLADSELVNEFVFARPYCSLSVPSTRLTVAAGGSKFSELRYPFVVAMVLLCT